MALLWGAQSARGSSMAALQALPCVSMPAQQHRGLPHTHLTSSQTSPPNRWCTMHVPCAPERRGHALSALAATVPGAHAGTVSAA